ncbi:MAG: hypothetical protein KKC79_07275, partial [Gammaproteobacteria bacterium]|nr:hypothetical protein [Gammaproteobacteria bacterium]
ESSAHGSATHDTAASRQTGTPAVALDPLSDLLKRQDLAASAEFRRIEPALRDAWEGALVDRIEDAVEGLDFSRALRLIAQAAEAGVHETR